MLVSAAEDVSLLNKSTIKHDSCVHLVVPDTSQVSSVALDRDYHESSASHGIYDACATHTSCQDPMHGRPSFLTDTRLVKHKHDDDIDESSMISHAHAQEASREVRGTWRMFKNDPLSPLRSYIGNYAWPGIGLFLEGYGTCPGSHLMMAS